MERLAGHSRSTSRKSSSSHHKSPGDSNLPPQTLQDTQVATVCMAMVLTVVMRKLELRIVVERMVVYIDRDYHTKTITLRIRIKGKNIKASNTNSSTVGMNLRAMAVEIIRSITSNRTVIPTTVAIRIVRTQITSDQLLDVVAQIIRSRYRSIIK